MADLVDGEIVNSYSTTVRLSAGVPTSTWAVYLAGRDGRFRLLGFDLDDAGAGGTVAEDAALLGELLSAAGIGHVVCASGPGAGRHVWVRIPQGVDAGVVAGLALDVKAVCPSLDHGMLMNPATGCLRPPGAPHRVSGRSTVIAGDVDELLVSTVTEAQIIALAGTVRELAAVAGLARSRRSEQQGAPAAAIPVPVDEEGHPRLPVPRRELPSFARDALDRPVRAGVDASAVLWRVLIGAAWAGWSLSEVAALTSWPGMERLRTLRSGERRVPRPVEGSQSGRAVLEADWRRAVAHAAARPRMVREGVSARAAAAAAVVDVVQRRADAAVGRWGRSGGGGADRRVLDVLMLLVLQAAQTSVEADVRRVALLAGVGRETARRALWRLAGDGWVRRVREADGAGAAVWTIDPQDVIHRGLADSGPQLLDTPAPAPETLYRHLVDSLTVRISDFCHDVFTAHGLGHVAGNVYARAGERAGGGEARAVAEQLAAEGLLVRAGEGWAQAQLPGRDAVAQRWGVAGVLHARGERYGREREAWAWWLAELSWMTARSRTDARRRPRPGQSALVALAGKGHAFAAHPRRRDGRADFAAARAWLERAGPVAA